MRTKASLIVVSAVLLSLGTTAMPLAAQSLADVARKEQDRRKAIKKPAKLLTNKDLTGPGSTGSAATPDAAGTATGAADADKTKAAGNGTDKKAEGPAKDQAYWSGRAKDLQTQLERDQTFSVAMQSRINALTTQYTNQADPAQQALLASDKQKSLAELNRLAKQIEDDKKAIADLQEDARRAGVPAAWLR